MKKQYFYSILFTCYICFVGAISYTTATQDTAPDSDIVIIGYGGTSSDNDNIHFQISMCKKSNVVEFLKALKKDKDARGFRYILKNDKNDGGSKKSWVILDDNFKDLTDEKCEEFSNKTATFSKEHIEKLISDKNNLLQFALEHGIIEKNMAKSVSVDSSGEFCYKWRKQGNEKNEFKNGTLFQKAFDEYNERNSKKDTESTDKDNKKGDENTTGSSWGDWLTYCGILLVCVVAVWMSLEFFGITNFLKENSQESEFNFGEFRDENDFEDDFEEFRDEDNE